MSHHVRLRSIALVLSIAALLAPIAAPIAAQQPSAAIGDALARLEAGNRRFVAGAPTAGVADEASRRSMAAGQRPYAIVVAPSDSRVPPERLFDAGLGELFVLRTAGPVCTPEVLASIEYAAEHLGASVCVFLVPQGSDAVREALADAPTTPHGERLRERLRPALATARREAAVAAEVQDRAEVEVVQTAVADALRRSPVLRDLARVRRFDVAAARYEPTSGVVAFLPRRTIPPEPDAPPTGRLQKQKGIPPQVAYELLRAGHQRFLTGAARADVTPARREAVVATPRPFAAVLGCADSRVAPEVLFDAGLGDLDVVRVAGNVPSDDAIASLEAAALTRGVGAIVVLGHTSCGAVGAAVHASEGDGHEATESLRRLVAHLEVAVESVRAGARSPQELVARAVRAHAVRTARVLTQRSEALRKLVDRGELVVLAAVYDLATGDVEWLDGKPADAAVVPPAPAVETAVVVPSRESALDAYALPPHVEPVPESSVGTAVGATGGRDAQSAPAPAGSDALLIALSALTVLAAVAWFVLEARGRRRASAGETDAA